MWRLYTSILVLGMAMPAFVVAHGGFEKIVDDYIVSFTQDPLAPLVGENVTIYVQLMDKDFQPIKDTDVTLTITDTSTNDPASDVVIFNDRYRTNVNGAFNFNYRFNKENYFDVEVAFIDGKTGREEQTGYLLEPRTVPKQLLVVSTLGALFAGLFAGTVLRRFSTVLKKTT